MSLKFKRKGRTAALTLAAAVALGAQPGFAQEAPTEVRVAVIPTSGPENVWDQVVIDAIARVDAEKDDDLPITYEMAEAVYGDRAESVMRLMAKSDRYDIILSAGPRSDQIENLKTEFPDIMWVSMGSGNQSSGENHYLYLGRVHEAAYLLGILAAGVSKTGVIGAVGSFPAPDVNDQLNGYLAGARSVNPEAKLQLTFIESWYDPPKATEATYAQISAGADVLYQMAGQVYEPCKREGKWCLSMYKDTSDIAPEVVLSGTALLWDPAVREIVGIWTDHKTNGTPFAGYTEGKWFGMKDGGSDISPYHDLAAQVPDEIKQLIDETKAKIVSGEFEVPLIDDSVPNGQ